MGDIVTALQSVFSLANLLAIFVGVAGGIVIGALPGLSSVMGLSILLPFTLNVNGMGGILMLLGVFCGSIYGGSISATLINTPGTSASAATALDGYPMATKLGQPGRALGISTTASLFGGVFSCFALIFFSPLLAKIALQFSAPEYFALAVFGISIIVSVSSESLSKGLIMGTLGLLLGTVGMDPMTSDARFTFGSIYLLKGISFVPLLIGVFAFAQTLLSVEELSKNKKDRAQNIKIKASFTSKSDMKRILPTLFRSSIIGTLIGAVPGTGGDIASWISYNEAKRWSKHKEEFGHGSPEGIAASESGNNAISGGALVPLLTLGIPGDAGTAVMMGSLIVQGLQPGPLLFKEQMPQVYVIFIGLLLANIVMGILGFAGIRLFAHVINIAQQYLIPLIFIFCVVGTYALNNSLGDIYFMLIIGLLAYFMIKLKFPMPPLMLGLILGPMAESNLRRSLILSNGDESILFRRPISLAFMLLSVLSLFLPVMLPLIKRKSKSRKKECSE